jgi:hypothetical protein
MNHFNLGSASCIRIAHLRSDDHVRGLQAAQGALMKRYRIVGW